MGLDRLSFLLKGKHSINGLLIPVNSYKTTTKELQNSYKFFGFAGIKWFFFGGVTRLVPPWLRQIAGCGAAYWRWPRVSKRPFIPSSSSW